MPGTPPDPSDGRPADRDVDRTADRAGYRDADAIPADDLVDESPDSVTDPDVPVADKGETTRPMNDTDRPANGRSSTPPGANPANPGEAAADAAGDEPLGTEELDLAAGEMDDEVLTQGESVIDAEYRDRGPAELDSGVDASGAADVADTENGDVVTGTRGARTAEDVSIVDDDDAARD